MLRSLVTFLLGTLLLEISGGSMERFLNLALAQHLRLWKIQRLPDKMRVTLTVADFFALRPVARGARCRVRIMRRMGFPFLLRRLRQRPLLLAGAIACLATLIWASGHLWVIEVRVTGPHYLDPRAVAAVAAEAGLRKGARTGSVDIPRVTQRIKDRIGEVSWAVIRVQGTRAVIEVVEKASVVTPDKAACVNLVARKDGVIEQAIPFQGEPLVKKGDVVRRGETLVECALRYWGGGRPGVLPGTPLPPRESVARTLVAQASVKALISYRQYMELPTFRSLSEPTGRTERQWELKWKGRSILSSRRNEPSFPRYRTASRVFTLGEWRIWKSPVELVIHDIEETTVRTEPVPLADLEEQAREAMQRRLTWMLSPNDRILRPIRAEVTQQGNGYAAVLVTVETLEEIAVPVEGAGPVLPPAAGP